MDMILARFCFVDLDTLIFAQLSEHLSDILYKYGNRHFWCRGYYVSTVGRNRRAIEEYIKNQLQEDYTDDQLSIKEFVDPFTGEPVRGGK